jgi:adenylylsulfate kinase
VRALVRTSGRSRPPDARRTVSASTRASDWRAEKACAGSARAAATTTDRTSDVADDGFAIWITGLSGSGKSALAAALRSALVGRGRRVEILDGDEVRTRLAPELGFSRGDRDEKVRRLAYVARLLARQGAVVIVAATSPYREARDQARREIERFVEVYLDCPLEVCVGRDGTGRYRRALAGELPHFTGISAPYEPPRAPEVVVPSAPESPEAGAQRVLNTLADLGYLRPADDEQTAVELPTALVRRLAERDGAPDSAGAARVLTAMLAGLLEGAPVLARPGVEDALVG